MSSPDQLTLQPADQWFTEREPEGVIELHDPFDGTPLRGFNFDREATEPPTQFGYNIDWHDGFMTWRDARAQTDDDSFSLSVLLTDPARPDGLGSPEFLKYALGEFQMIGHAATRSVYHSARQHGIQPHLYGGMPFGSRLGDPRPNPDYQEQLDALLLEAGVPSFSFDPSFGPNEPAQNLAAGVQNVRAVAYVEASNQEAMKNPDFAFFVPDFVHTSALQWLQLGVAGLRMREIADERNYGELPESLLLIAPFEQSALIDKLGAVTGLEVNADVALKEIVEPSYADDQYGRAYATVLRTGQVPTR